MSDITERLRARTVPQWTHTTGFGSRMNGHKPDELCHEAADEIERLRGEADVLRHWISVGLMPLQSVADLEDFEDGGECMQALLDAGRALAVKP